MSTTGFLDLCDLARAAVARGDLPAGRRRFEEAMEMKPDSLEVRYGLATVCFMMRDPHAARAHFSEVQLMDPSHAGASINLGAIANLLGDYDEAIRQLRRGIQLDPKRSETYYNLGIAYRKLGRNELAIQAYREAHHHNPRMVEAVYNLANVYFEMERYEQAATFYRKALDINPGFKKAAEGVARVEARLRPAAPAGEFGDEEAGPLDPLTGNSSADRLLNPESDFDILSRCHAATDEAKGAGDAWVKSTEDLRASVRDLAIGISTYGGGPDVNEIVERFRAAVIVFRKAKLKIDEKCRATAKVRDFLAQRG